MSDTQDTDPQPTPGPYAMGVTTDDSRRIVEVLNGNGVTTSDVHSKCHSVQGKEPFANAQLTLAAFEAAHEAAEMGYDSQKAVANLPKLIREVEALIEAEFKEEGVIYPSLNKVISEMGGDPLGIDSLDDALASAEGSGDD